MLHTYFSLKVSLLAVFIIVLIIGFLIAFGKSGSIFCESTDLDDIKQTFTATSTMIEKWDDSNSTYSISRESWVAYKFRKMYKINFISFEFFKN